MKLLTISTAIDAKLLELAELLQQREACVAEMYQEAAESGLSVDLSALSGQSGFDSALRAHGIKLAEFDRRVLGVRE
ncbi:hypothetical protein QBK99_08170 [Corticibacterium sp. UT-5YL-CI-8]|nr:hypothetical protein [Tianweitania sp. UT-5YL-CI-8]